MSIRILFFASLRETLGASTSLELQDLPVGPTVADVRAALLQRGGAYAQALAPGKLVRFAVNQTLAEPSTLVPPQAEVAIFPPVTGG